ncbi:PAS domain-containing sensor histidine kinase [Natronobiforma cellulositropha]|uniref:PAS domain-containing sensor histidine kinase n=1 Tax=Natronobiforma cellulositropha TaxID=1679076 RepID=UPI0021D594D3|nr:PAS domain-containing sensor histidine kinase [Natronobiforma cellulositropha]
MSDPGPLVAAAFDVLPSTAAILDSTGDIVRTNETWRWFGRENDGPTDVVCGHGNYLEVCDASDDPVAAEAAAGIRALLEGDESTVSFEYPCHSPGTKRWFTMQATAFEHGGERYVLVVHADITERRLAEERVAAQAERMESFAGMLSHDLRNPLSVALAEVSHLADVTDGSAHESLHSSLERMSTIIDDALVLASADDVDETRACSLETLTRAAWSHVETSGSALEVRGSETVDVDPDLVGHLFENLFRNAIEHGTRPGTERESDEPGVTVRVGTLEDGFYVEDDGPGIPPETRDHVFESGYSTVEEGSGYGLHIVDRVARAHGWSVSVGASEDGGARFEITGATHERTDADASATAP